MGVKISAMTELPVANLAVGDFTPIARGGTENNYKVDLGALIITPPTGALLAVNNLSDVANAGTSRTNLGLAIGTNVQAYDAELAALASVTSAADQVPYFTGSGTATVAPSTAYGRGLWAATSASDIKPTESFIIACSDETTALTAGTAKVTIRLPYAFTVTEVFADLTVAQASGSIFTVDINESGTSILSTKLTIDNTETDSDTATTPAVISDPSLARRAPLSVDIDQIGDGTAAGLKVTIVGHRT